MSEQIELSKIRRDGGTQSRVKLDMETVKEYMSAMSEGAKFPPITVFYDGQDYWLADGFHRLEAIKVRSWVENPNIEAEVLQGTQRDAMLYSVGANSTHGLRRSNADKRQAVETLLRDEEWAQWSDREIAKRCGVSAPFAGDIRREMAGVNGLHLSNERKGADGKTYTVKHWSLSKPMAFWDRVKRYGLDKNTIVETLQPGAKLLTDVTLSKEETWERLDALAIQQVAHNYPKHRTVKHSSGHYGEVLGHNPTTLLVKDYMVNAENLWQVDDTTLSSYEEYLESLPPDTDDTPDTEETWNGFPIYRDESSEAGPQEFRVGDIVNTPTNHEGTVLSATGRNVLVQTVNGEHEYRSAFLTLIRRPEAAEVSPPDVHDFADLEYEEIIAPAFARIFDYAEGSTEAVPQLHEDIEQCLKWLSGMEEVLESELGEPLTET
jgi:hypothetical protein